MLIERGAPSDGLSLVLEGEVVQHSGTGPLMVLTAGQTVGEMGVIMRRPWSASVWAGPQGARLFVLPVQAFEELLSRSRRFDRGLMVLLAQRLASTMAETA
jgi:CRP-like cAMP-binding protein